MDLNAATYVAGHRGMVGSAILRALRAQGATNLITRTRAECDLTDRAQVEAFFADAKPKYVYLAAAKVGGMAHFFVYAAIGWGLWKMRPWVWWVGSLYLTQVAIAMFLWPLFQSQGGWIGAVIAGTLFAIPAIAFWRAKDQFQGVA